MRVHSCIKYFASVLGLVVVGHVSFLHSGSKVHRLPRAIPFRQIEKCFPFKWRRSIKQPLVTRKKTKLQFHFDYEVMARVGAEMDERMVEGLLVTLKDYASQGHLLNAIRMFSLIRGHALVSCSAGVVVESLSPLLLSCTQLKLHSQGKQLHAQAITWGLQKNYVLVRKLVSYYAALDLLDDAHFIAVVSNIRRPLLWNIIIGSYVIKGRFSEAISAFKQMIHKGIRPDNFTYPSVLKACAEQSNLGFGRAVHKSIINSSMDWDLFVQNALISLYAKCGDLETARSIFDEMPVKNEVSWNSIISGYVSMGKWDDTLQLIEGMQEAGSNMNIITWNILAGACLSNGNFERALELLSQMYMTGIHLDPVAVIIGVGACSHIGALKSGKEFHGLAIRNSLVDYVNVKNALITLYSRCGDLRHACTVFRSVEAKDISTWNSMVSGYARLNHYEEASFLFRELLELGVEPNYTTLASLLPLCARVANLRHGKELHCYILKHEGSLGHLLLWNALIDMYARSGKVAISRVLFDLMDEKDVVTYTSLIAGYRMQGEDRVALELFEEMINSQIKPDHIAMIAVLSACSHSGLVAQGRSMFEKMQRTYGITPCLEHYSCMADLYGRAGQVAKAKEVILSMPYKPTADIWATLLGACRFHGERDIGHWAAEKLMEMKPQNPGYYVLIANMYAEAGCWNKLAEVRTFMKDVGVRKDPGCASGDIGIGFPPSLAEDTSIYPLLGGLTDHMKDIDLTTFEDYDVVQENFLESLV